MQNIKKVVWITEKVSFLAIFLSDEYNYAQNP